MLHIESNKNDIIKSRNQLTEKEIGDMSLHLYKLIYYLFNGIRNNMCTSKTLLVQKLTSFYSLKPLFRLHF